MDAQNLISEAIALPVEKRALLVDSLLKSLNPTESDIDAKWTAVAEFRLQQIRTGEVNSIPADEVFREIWNRLSK